MAKRKKKQPLEGATTVPETGQATEALPMAGEGEVVVDAPAPPRSQQSVQALTPGSNEPMDMSPDVQVNVGGAAKQESGLSDEEEMNQFFDYDVDDIVGDDPAAQEVLKDLRASATSDMKPSRKLALAFTALADPEYARSVVREHASKKERAQQTLMGLGTQVMGMRKEGQKQAMIADRATKAQMAAFEKQTAAYVAKAEEAEKKRQWEHNSRMIQERIKEMGAMQIPTNLLPPTDMTDEAAVQGYLIATQDEMTQGIKVLQTIEFFEENVDLETVDDSAAALDAFRTVAMAKGNTPEQAEDMVEGYGPMITSRVKLAREVHNSRQRKIDAEIARYDANIDEARMKVRQIEQAIKTNDIKDLRTQSLVVKDMATAYSQMEGDYAQLVQQGQDLAWLEKQGEIDRPTFLALSEENKALRQQAMPRLGEFGRLLQHAQQRMQQFDRKMKASSNYERIFNNTLQQTLLANPELAEDPAMTMEMLMSGPMEGPRMQFWYQVQGRLIAEYPGMSMNEIYSLIDEDAAEQLMLLQQPGMPAQTHESGAQPQGAAIPGMPTPQAIEPGGGKGVLGSAKEWLGAAMGTDPRSQRQQKDNE
jgi:hypothetical protein